ncbi:TraR/DksA family transcriptional regulator [Nitratidesulfovibrio sp.]|uniref:TraR/DksA family transcriptional regulator n=1 Tax=Nitratidesulfovibrio sp. TaxID=2802297 RepID=UPI00333EB3C1
MREETIAVVRRRLKQEIRDLREALDRWRGVQGVEDAGDPERLPDVDGMTYRSWKQRTEARLQVLRATLERLDDEDFGYCDDCGNEIPAARLLAVPTTTRCVHCMSEREERGVQARPMVF